MGRIVRTPLGTAYEVDGALYQLIDADTVVEEEPMAKSSKPGLTTKGGKPALNVQVPADLKKASKKGEVK